jgi:tetratricopeptide (TPR) repeat protein
MEKLLPRPEDDQPDKKKKLFVKEPTHQEASSKDIEVGDYYLQTKNWKAALSRFESAMVLDPENPEVYWGLAEAEHHLSDFADAKAHYLKLLEYDPDGPHGKQARRELKDTGPVCGIDAKVGVIRAVSANALPESSNIFGARLTNFISLKSY